MTATTEAATAGAARFQPAELLQQALIQELAVSPDGASVVYSRRVIEDGKYRKRLWRVPFDGGTAEPLTAAEASDGQPRFSPDGRTLLYLSDRSGKNQVWLLPLTGGEPRQLTALDGDVRAAEWSPEGSRVLLVAPSGEDRYLVGDPKDPVARRITDFRWRLDQAGVVDQCASAYVVPAAGGEPVRLTDPGLEVHAACWSPEGDRIAFVADRDDDAGLRVDLGSAKLWAIPADAPGADPVLLAALEGPVAAARWDQGGVAVLGVGRATPPQWAWQDLFLVDDGGPRQLGAELDRPVLTATFGDLIDPTGGVALLWLDRSTILALVSDQGAAHPYRFGTDGSAERLAGGDIVATSLATGGSRIAMVATDRGQPGEVYAVEPDGARRLTTNGSEWLEPFRRDPVRVRVPHPEGHGVDAWLIAGRDAPRPGPLAIQIHGGPHAAHGPTPWLEMLALADAGIHVLYANPRGSTGYGGEFAGAIHGRWGDPDGSDVMRVVDWAIEERIADPRRVGVFGLSGGGFMTNWLLGHEPGRFAAAVSENPVTDFVSMFAGSDLTMAFDERFVGLGTLPEDIDAFLRRSPFMQIHRNEAPLLLLQCDGDLRCPPTQSEMVFAILRSRGRTVEMVRYPQESHYLVGYGRPDRRVDRIERIVGWFDRYL